MKTLRHWARRFLPTTFRQRLREIIDGPRVDEVELVHQVFSRRVGHEAVGVMVDVGAHCGATLENFAMEGWQIFAFEPDPDNRSQLEGFCKRFEQVTIDERALSDHPVEDMPWFQSEVSTGISSLASFHESHRMTGTVEVTTLTQALAEHKIEGVDFLKIDTEGHDLFVLRGFPWQRFEPEVIVCEFEDNKTEKLGYSFDDLAGFLAEKGYRILVSEWHPITAYGAKHSWRRIRPYPCELAEARAWGNLIAMKREDDLERALTLSKKWQTGR